jgi:hypothetical protein
MSSLQPQPSASVATATARSDVEQTLGTSYAHAASQLALHAWRRGGTLHVPHYIDLIHAVVEAHGCSGHDALAAIKTLSDFPLDPADSSATTEGARQVFNAMAALDLKLIGRSTDAEFALSNSKPFDDTPLWQMQREGRGVALLTLQMSPEHWRRFTQHFDTKVEPLQSLVKAGDSENKISGLVDMGLVIDLDRSRPGAIALLNTWDENWRDPARRYSVASIAALKIPRSKLELFDVSVPTTSRKAVDSLPDLTGRVVSFNATEATFENRFVTITNHAVDATLARCIRGHPNALRVLGRVERASAEADVW